MKKVTRLLLLLGVLTALLCVSAMAAEEPTTAGIYDITPVSGVTITPVGTKSAVEIGGASVSDFYAGAEKLTVSYAGAQSGAYYLLLVTNKATTAPTVDDIVYIDQLTAVSSGVSFTAYPSALGKGTYYVYLSTNAGSGLGKGGLEEVGTFKSYVPYKLGDVDGENGLNSYDASLILQHLVGTYEFVGNGGLAADVDCENGVNSYDASLILQHLVGTYTIPGWEE